MTNREKLIPTIKSKRLATMLCGGYYDAHCRDGNFKKCPAYRALSEDACVDALAKWLEAEHEEEQ